jgi:cardiolipin synthase A/B
MSAGKEVPYLKYTSQNKIKLIRGGKHYFDLLLNLINISTLTIHLQTYIFDDDETGQSIAQALISASKRNVQVFLLVDGYASQSLSENFVESLTNAGVYFRFFDPIFKSEHYYFGRRLHHKVFVVDAKYALVGGINIANHYNDMPLKPSWLDFAVLVEGETAIQLCDLCWNTWKKFQVKNHTSPCNENVVSFDFKVEEKCLVSIRRNDWVRRKNEISASYFEMLKRSNSHITIFCSYFLPGHKIRKLLKNAAKRGVKIRIVIAGPSDVALAKNAEKWLYDWFLRNKIQLYEYQSTILHAKIAVCDSQWLTIGSYNINDISAFASIELNLDVRNPDFVKTVENSLDFTIKNECIKITENELRHSKNIFKQFLLWCSYQIFQITFFLFTFYFKQSDR